MNIDLKKINWEPGKAPSKLQLMTLRIRKKSDPDEGSSYITITEDLQVYTDGTILNPPVINDLEEETIYIFRVLNNLTPPEEVLIWNLPPLEHFKPN